MSYEPEAWEGEIYEHLELCCATHPRGREAAQAPIEAGVASASPSELAEGLARMPTFDDDTCVPRLA